MDIAAGGYHSVALKADGTVEAWGAGSVNMGSSPDYGQSMVPAGLSGVVAVAGGGYHTLALKADGTLAAWGAGAVNSGVSPDYGQSMVPAGLSNVVMTAAGSYHSLALTADGTVVAWGDNTYGQSAVPAGLGNVAGIAAGRYFSLALKSDGTFVAWGNNAYNQTNVPGSLANVVSMAGGGFQVLAIESDGSPAPTTQPVSQTAAAGANVILAAMAVGNPAVELPVASQWDQHCRRHHRRAEPGQCATGRRGGLLGDRVQLRRDGGQLERAADRALRAGAIGDPERARLWGGRSLSVQRARSRGQQLCHLRLDQPDRLDPAGNSYRPVHVYRYQRRVRAVAVLSVPPCLDGPNLHRAHLDTATGMPASAGVPSHRPGAALDAALSCSGLVCFFVDLAAANDNMRTPILHLI